MKATQRFDEFGNNEIFESDYNYRFKYPLWKVIGRDREEKRSLPIDFEFRGEYFPNYAYCHVIDTRYSNFDGYRYRNTCEKIAEPDNYVEYLKTVNPDKLRIDYKRAYEKLKLKYNL